MMDAIIKEKRGPGLKLIQAEKPSIKSDEILIRIKKTAICGTDVHIYDWDLWAEKTIEPPLIVGHEYIGEVVEIGDMVKGFQTGDRVSGEGHLVCGFCRNCRIGRRHLCRNTEGIGVQVDGAFAHYLALPAVNAVKLPDCIPDNIGAILDPFGNAAHTALSFDMTGEDVLITGAGPIGIMAAALSTHIGARNVVITDVNDYRLNLAKKVANCTTVNVTQQKIEDVMKALNIYEGFDVGLEMSGQKAAFSLMLHAMNHGGNIALLGIPSNDLAIDWNQVIFKGLTMKGIYGREMFDTWYKMIALIESGLDVANVITHEFDYTDFEKAFQLMKSGQSGKIILNWDA